MWLVTLGLRLERIVVDPNADEIPKSTCDVPSRLVDQRKVVEDAVEVVEMDENWKAGRPQMETRLLDRSAMMMRPSGRMSTPVGEEKLSCPDPKEPNFSKKLPLLSNFWMRLLLASAT